MSSREQVHIKIRNPLHALIHTHATLVISNPHSCTHTQTHVAHTQAEPPSGLEPANSPWDVGGKYEITYQTTLAGRYTTTVHVSPPLPDGHGLVAAFFPPAAARALDQIIYLLGHQWGANAQQADTQQGLPSSLDWPPSSPAPESLQCRFCQVAWHFTAH
jgi:hypothetical protein